MCRPVGGHSINFVSFTTLEICKGKNNTNVQYFFMQSWILKITTCYSRFIDKMALHEIKMNTLHEFDVIFSCSKSAFLVSCWIHIKKNQCCENKWFCNKAFVWVHKILLTIIVCGDVFIMILLYFRRVWCAVMCLNSSSMKNQRCGI